MGAAGRWGSVCHELPVSLRQPEGPVASTGRDPTGRTPQGVTVLSFFYSCYFLTEAPAFA